MGKRALTAAAVERLKPPARGQAWHFDSGYPGLALRVSYKGTKAWAYKYRVAGRQRLMTLGTFPSMGLAEARRAWRLAREEVAAGRDPAAEPVRPPDTFGAVFEEWLQRDQAGNRSAAEVRRLIERDLLPRWRDRLLADIGRRDVIEALDSIADRGALTVARRVHAHAHRLFRWAVGRGLLAANPMSDLPKHGAEVKRDRVLSDGELALAWRAAGGLGWPFGPAVRLLVLTGARRDEIGSLRWEEIDAERAEIALAGARTKAGRPHTIPLAPATLALLEELPRFAASPFVFTSSAGSRPVSGWSKGKRRLDAAMLELARKEAREAGAAPGEAARITLPPWRVHDLRRTVATGLQRLRVDLQTIEAILGHVGGSRAGIVGIYQRHRFADEKRAALEAWARFLSELIDGRPAGNVVAGAFGRHAGAPAP